MRKDLLDAALFDPPPSPMPGLALPFALVGGAAGWLSAGFIANPIMIWGQEGLQAPAAAVGAVICAVMGSVLRRWCQPKNPFSDASVGKLRLAVIVLVAGTLTGSLTAGLMMSYKGAITEGFFLGLLCSLPFIPICALVLDAARRAERARHGSIVAASDRREVWSILMACLALATLFAIPDWSVFAQRRGPAPIMAVLMAASAGLLILALLLADRRAIRAVALATQGMEAPEEGETMLGGGAVPKVDLGLGDDIGARLSRSAAAYRSRDRAVALVLGSREQAEAALRRAIRRNIVGLSLCAATLLTHGVSAAFSTGRAPKDGSELQAAVTTHG